MSGTGDFSIGGTVWPGLSKLIEEIGEVNQVCGKLIGSRGVVEHWDGTNLRDELEKELADLITAAHFVITHNKLDVAAIHTRVLVKTERFEKWHNRTHGNDVEAQRCPVCQGLVDLDDGCLRCKAAP